MTDRHPDTNPLRNVTIPGRLLVVGTGFFIGAGITFVLLGFAQSNDLPPGRYPVVILILPVVLGGGPIFLIGRWIMRRVGIPFWRE
jgi:hypothetical protein